MAQHRRAPRRDEICELAANYPAADISLHTRELENIRKQRRATYTVPGTDKLANDAYMFIARAFEASGGDPIFRDTLRALVSYGLAGKRAERRFEKLHAQMTFGPLVNQELSVAEVQGAPISVQQACERVAARHQPEIVSEKAEDGDQDAGFESAVKEVQRARSEYENMHPGDLGTMVVIAREDLINPRGSFPKGAKMVRNDKAWRLRLAMHQFVRVD